MGRRWTEERIRRELDAFLPAFDSWPGYPVFRASGRRELWEAIVARGGPARFAADYGLPYAPNARGLGDVEIRARLRAALRGSDLAAWPSRRWLERTPAQSSLRRSSAPAAPAAGRPSSGFCSGTATGTGGRPRRSRRRSSRCSPGAAPGRAGASSKRQDSAACTARSARPTAMPPWRPATDCGCSGLAATERRVSRRNRRAAPAPSRAGSSALAGSQPDDALCTTLRAFRHRPRFEALRPAPGPPPPGSTRLGGRLGRPARGRGRSGYGSAFRCQSGDGSSGAWRLSRERSGAQATRRRRRLVDAHGRRARRDAPGSRDPTEDAQHEAVGPRCRRRDQRGPARTVQRLADGLKGRPARPSGPRSASPWSASASGERSSATRSRSTSQRQSARGSVRIGGIARSARCRYHSAQAVSGESARYSAPTTSPRCQRLLAGTAGRCHGSAPSGA